MRKNKLDPQTIRDLVGDGLSNTEIATRMGWTVGTLYVRCSQLKISLRRSSKKVRLKRWPRIPLPDELFEQLRQRAAAMGVSTAELVVDLLKEIVRDGLYDAVLDRDDFDTSCPVAKHAA
jgi:hypothetical protein